MTTTSSIGATGTVGSTGSTGFGYGFQMTKTEYFKSVLQGSHSKAQELVEQAHMSRTFNNIDRNIVDKAREASDSLRQLSGENTQIKGASFGKTGATTAFAQFGPAAMGIRA